MANAIFTSFAEGIISGAISLEDAVIKAAFVRGYTFDATDVFVSEVVATGTFNGTPVALSNKTITGGVFDADDVTIATTASASNHGILLYQASAVTGGSDVANTSQRLIAYYDTGTGLPIQPGTGDTPISWSSGTNRILKVG